MNRMNRSSSYWQSALAGRISRRRALGGAAALGAAAALAACRGGGDGAAEGGGGGAGEAEGPPKPGGIYRTATNVIAPHFSPIHRGADPSAQNTWRRDFGYYDKLWG